jgi:hypothetical protein
MAPVLHDLPIRDAEHVHRPYLHSLAGGRQPLKNSLVCAAHRDADRYSVPFGDQVFDGDVQGKASRASEKVPFKVSMSLAGGSSGRIVVWCFAVHDLLSPVEVSRGESGPHGLDGSPEDGVACESLP